MAKRKKPLGAGLTQAIGGALVGLDQQIFRAMPRVEERFKHRDEVSLAAADGGTLLIELPGDAETPTPQPSDAPDDGSDPSA
jgi:hypothetical protein